MYTNLPATGVLTTPCHNRSTYKGTLFSFAEARNLISSFAQVWNAPAPITNLNQGPAILMHPQQLQQIRPGAQQLAFIWCMNRNANGQGQDAFSIAAAGINNAGQALNGLVAEKWPPDNLGWPEDNTTTHDQQAARTIARYLAAHEGDALQARTQVCDLAAHWQHIVNGARNPRQPLAYCLPATTMDELCGRPGLHRIAGIFGYNRQQQTLQFMLVGINSQGQPVTGVLTPRPIHYTVNGAAALLDDMFSYNFL